VPELEDLGRRFLEQLFARPSGPLSLRFVIQPMIACLLAIRSGRSDARQGRAPFLWTILSDPGERRRLLHSGWQDVGKLFVMACLLDAVYQLFEFHWIYPLEALAIALVLAAMPYSITRGLVTRIVRRWSGTSVAAE
jgi:hypothetical protein